ncbi:MAG: acyl carrier protein [Anaerolineaceae bacterium]
MTPEKARQLVMDALHRVAPEIDLAAVSPGDDLREQLDIDSMDILNVMIDLSEKAGCNIDDEDYGNMETLGQCVDFLVANAP